MPKPLVVFTQEAWDWMRGYTLAVDTEIGGFGYVTNPDKGVFVVDTIYLAPQEVSNGGVHFKDDAMGYMVEKAVSDERLNDARFSWHSHNTMNCFWSSTDEEGIRDYRETGMPWLISAVTNHKGEVKVRVDLFDSVIGHVSITDAEVQVGLADPDMRAEIMKDISELVEKRTFTNPTRGTANGSSQSSSNGGKHRPAGQKQLPAGKSAEWWDEIDWGSITDEELTAIMKEHGFDVDAEPVDDDEEAARQMAKIEAMH